MKRKYINQDPESGQTYPAMQETQHTPPPWHLGDTDDVNNIYEPESGDLIAECRLDGDSAFIVKAVNSLEEHEAKIFRYERLIKTHLDNEEELKAHWQHWKKEAQMLADRVKKQNGIVQALMGACITVLQSIKNKGLYHEMKVSVTFLEDAIKQAQGE